MLVIAQRVLTEHGEDVNTFLHLHGPRNDWQWELPADIPNRTPGKPVLEEIRIRGRGRIRSYLDVAVPDGTAPEELLWARTAVFSLVRIGGRVPLMVGAGPFYAQFELEPNLEEAWQQELEILTAAVFSLAQRHATVSQLPQHG